MYCRLVRVTNILFSNIYTYGKNRYGQLGHGDRTDLKTPKLV